MNGQAQLSNVKSKMRGQRSEVKGQGVNERKTNPGRTWANRTQTQTCASSAFRLEGDSSTKLQDARPYIMESKTAFELSPNESEGGA